MAFKMNYSPNKKTGEGFPYKTHLKAHEEGHDDDKRDINVVTDQPNPNVEVGELYRGADKKVYKKEAPPPKPFIDGKVNTAAGFSLDENGNLVYPD